MFVDSKGRRVGCTPKPEPWNSSLPSAGLGVSGNANSVYFRRGIFTCKHSNAQLLVSTKSTVWLHMQTHAVQTPKEVRSHQREGTGRKDPRQKRTNRKSVTHSWHSELGKKQVGSVLRDGRAGMMAPVCNPSTQDRHEASLS